MKNSNQTSLKIATLVSLICLLIPLTIYGLWIYAFNLGTTQVERVTIFKDYFPDFLNGRWDTTFISIAFCVVAILLSTNNLKRIKKNTTYVVSYNSDIKTSTLESLLTVIKPLLISICS